MPVSKSLKKISKKVKGKERSLHPNGRKFKQLNRATLREEKLQKSKIERHGQKEIQLFRYKFFQQVAKTALEKAKAAESDSQSKNTAALFTESELRDVIQRYIKRDDEELEKLMEKRRPGRPASSQQDALQQRIDKEKREYKSGFIIPDLMDSDNVSMLLNWTGTTGGLNVIKKIRVPEEGTIEKLQGSNTSGEKDKDVDME